MCAAPAVTNTSNQPFLKGQLTPVVDELDVASCRVTGEIPGNLRGQFIQNGPNPRFEPLGRYHMFDGDGMLHSLKFGDGSVPYKNRWIRTPMLEAEIRAGRALYPGLSNLFDFPDPGLVGDAGPIKNPANTNIIKHAGKMYALYETGLPVEVNEDLDTLGIRDFDGKLPGGITAHPRMDPSTGEMFFFAYSPIEPYLRYFAADAKGNLVHMVDLKTPAPTMIHDFLITDEHAVFLDSPLVFNMQAMNDGGPMVQFKPENGTRLGVMPRLGTADDMKWYEIENGHVQHFWNAWHEDGIIELSGSFNKNPQFGMDMGEDLESSSASGEAGTPTRFRIDLAKGEATVEQFDDMEGDFCRFRDDRNGSRTRHHYMGGFFKERGTIGEFDSVAKYDDQTNARQVWYSGKNHHVGEAVFAPDLSRSGEDDGWLLVSDHDHAENTTDICILDATDVSAGPIARVHLPQKLPLGFHVNWFPDEQGA
jgi:carotenoid cleavage dioxygenase-like enzyme